MWPFAEVRHKAALPIGGRPLMTWMLEAVAEIDEIAEIVLVTGFNPGSVRDAAEQADTGPVPIRCAPARERGGFGGTADAALRGIEALDPGLEFVLLLMGDCWFDREDLSRLCAQGMQLRDPLLLVSPFQAPNADPRSGVGVSVDAGRITQLLMQPRDDPGFRWAGAMLLPRSCSSSLASVPEAVDQVEVGAMPPAGADVAQWIGMRMERGHPTHALEGRGLCCDLDRPWELLWLNERIAERIVREVQESGGQILGEGASIDSSARVEGPIRLGRGSRIGPGVIIRGGLWAGDDVEITDGAVLDGPVIVGDRSRIARYCQVGERTVIGRDCRILHGAEVQGLFFNRFYAYHYCEFWGVCGTAVDLGAATVCGNLRFDDGETEHRVLERREVPAHAANAAYLGDYCRTGVNAILLPGVKIGIYSVVGPGTMVSGDIRNRSRVYSEQNITRKDWGPDRYAW
jgi:bifunctional UDP-N-acetylglucosamine pyrophosphorylase/glucosamine-1-phosphate N-acetyltransferase